MYSIKSSLEEARRNNNNNRNNPIHNKSKNSNEKFYAYENCLANIRSQGAEGKCSILTFHLSSFHSFFLRIQFLLLDTI